MDEDANSNQEPMNIETARQVMFSTIDATMLSVSAAAEQDNRSEILNDAAFPLTYPG